MNSRYDFLTHFEHSPFSIQLLSPEGRTLAVNKAWKLLWQIPEEIIQNYILKDYLMGEDPQLNAKGVGDVIRRGLAGEVVVIPAIHYVPAETDLTGDPRWVAGYMYPIRDSEGKLIEVVLTHQDITEQRKAEEALRQSRDELESAVHVRDEFISICSHELKTPLTSMKLQFQIAERKVETGDTTVYEPSQVQKRLANSTRQLNRMLLLIEEMLDVSRINSGKLQINKSKIDLVELLQESLTRFADEFSNSKISVSTDLGPKPLFILGDSYRLEQVISNLFTNAIKYADSKPLQITLVNRAGVARLEVTDHGIGIEDKDIDRIFNRFERIRSNHNIGGLGLGLFISKEIILAHEGKIWAESKINVGTKFIVELPAYAS